MDQREPIGQDLGLQDLNNTPFEGTCYQILPVTARSELSLQKLKHRISRWVSNNMQRDHILRDLAFTLNHGRSLHEYRHTLVAATVEDLQIGLDTESYPLGPAGDLAQVEFVFTGQGAQWFAMGRQLIGLQSAFTASLTASTAILRNLGACWDLLEELKLDSKRSRIARSEISQPSTTAIQIALVEVLQSVGICPTTVIGHSSGEIAAAYAAGHLSHESALRVAYHRGLISQNIDIKSGPKGGMLAVGLNESQSRAVISSMDDAYLTIACANSPHNTTISGKQDAVARLKSLLDRKGVFNRILQVDLAYHSDLLKPATYNYQAALEGLKLRKPDRLVKFISTVTGEYKDDDFGPSYWIQNLTSKVEFYAALRLLTGDKDEQSTTSATSKIQHILIELGPHSALRSVISQTCKARQRPMSSTYLPSLVKGQHAVESILKLVASLFDLGVHVQLRDLTLSTKFDASSRFVLDLPPYPWDHSIKYWHESRLSIAHRCRQFPPHHLIGLPVLGTSPFQLMWSNNFSIQSHPWLEDHIIDSFVTLPGASYLCMVHAAADQMCQSLPTSKKKLRYSFCDVSFLKALVFLEIDSEVEVNLSLMRSLRHQTSGLEGFWDFRIHSLSSEGQWSEHCQGSVNIEAFPILDGVEVFPEDQLQAAESEETFRRLSSSCNNDFNVQNLYQKLAEKGNAYGKSFALLQNVKTGHLNATGELLLPGKMTDLVHPNVLDAIMHLVFPICPLSSSAASIVPVKVKEAFLSSENFRQERMKLQVGTTVLPRGPQVFNAETLVFAADDTSRSSPLLILKAEFQAIGDASDPAQSGDSDGLAWNINWCPDVDLVEEGWLSSHCSTWAQDQKISPEQKHLVLNRTAAEQISTCLEKLTNGHREPQEPHLRRLLRWMEQFADTPEFKALRQGTSEIPSCDPDCLGVEGEAVTRLGKAVGSIIKGEVNPLEKLLEQDLLFQLYDDDSSNICAQRLAEYVKLLAFKSPDLTILEVGAGTGATTLPILQALAKSNLASFIRYQFTDISPSFFNAAEERLEAWSDLITYRVLDIEGDPGKQGFQTGAYDLIIAANVLHATSSISTSLSNVRKLLKPGGRLALIELVVSVPYINFIAGTLPGWWKGKTPVYLLRHQPS